VRKTASPARLTQLKRKIAATQRHPQCPAQGNHATSVAQGVREQTCTVPVLAAGGAPSATRQAWRATAHISATVSEASGAACAATFSLSMASPAAG
jgi:hypothetical protein